MTDKPILTRREAAEYLGITLAALAHIEADPRNDLIKVAGVRLTYRGEPTIRYRRDGLARWMQGSAA